MLPLERGPSRDGGHRAAPSSRAPRVEEFGVRILGVLDNAVGPATEPHPGPPRGRAPGRDRGHPGNERQPGLHRRQARGAVAYSFPFGKEPIAGITPIAEMIEATQRRHPPGSLGPLPAGPRPRGSARAPRPRGLRRRLRAAPAPGVVPGAFRGESLPPGLSGAALHPSRPAPGLLGLRPRDIRVGTRPLLVPGLRPGARGRARRPPPPSAPCRISSLAPRWACRSSKATSTCRPPAPSPTSTVTGSTPSAIPFYNLGPTPLSDEEGVRLRTSSPASRSRGRSRRRSTRWAPSTRIVRRRSPAVSATPRA